MIRKGRWDCTIVLNSELCGQCELLRTLFSDFHSSILILEEQELKVSHSAVTWFLCKVFFFLFFFCRLITAIQVRFKIKEGLVHFFLLKSFRVFLRTVG